MRGFCQLGLEKRWRRHWWQRGQEELLLCPQLGCHCQLQGKSALLQSNLSLLLCKLRHMEPFWWRSPWLVVWCLLGRKLGLDGTCIANGVGVTNGRGMC